MLIIVKEQNISLMHVGVHLNEGFWPVQLLTITFKLFNLIFIELN